MTPEIEALCQKWIEEEERLRNKANDAWSAGDQYIRHSGQADQLHRCRRELQEVAGLAVKAP